ncbi:MAG: lysine 2,3-aminomutase [Desulfuromonadales bacterium C00003068]|nr:MAG: lysine 2,3-aminomutase [Desulfuromonadales bacterium C00003068]
MEPWLAQHKNSITDPHQLADHFGLHASELAQVAQRYPLRLTPYLLERITDSSDPLGQQFIPQLAELANDDAQLTDPLNEEVLSPVPHLVHRYPQRVLLLVAGSCFSYCRFCTRKRKVGCEDMVISFGDILKGIDYIAGHPEVNEVILSGGDPLTMSDRLLEDILNRLQRIPHVEVVRIGSRAPVVLPARITPALCELLGRYQPLYFLTHFNHPTELTTAAIDACRQLVNAGVPVVNQTVLLRGVNDDATVLHQLFYTLHRLRIRPYYLHQMDLTCGTGHFRTRLEDGIAIMDQLRGPLSGLAVPTYIVDLPGGHGKVPVTPDYVHNLGENAQLRAADGTLVDYRQWSVT